MEHPGSTAETREDGIFWSEYMTSYDKVFSSLPPYREMMAKAVETLAQCNHVLDSSAGAGYLTKRLLDAGKQVTALEIHPEVLEILRANLKEHKDKLNLVVGDGQQLPFGDQTFDGVASILVLPFVDDTELYIREHARVLRQGGVITVAGPFPEVDSSNTAIQWGMELHKLGLLPDLRNDFDIVVKRSQTLRANGLHWFNESEIVNLLSQVGELEIISSIPNPLYYGAGYLITAQKQFTNK